jgi:hypothetical protein
MCREEPPHGIRVNLHLAGDAGLQATCHSARMRERAATQTSLMGGSTSLAGQTRDFGVDRLKQHKTAPGWGSPGPIGTAWRVRGGITTWRCVKLPVSTHGCMPMHGVCLYNSLVILCMVNFAGISTYCAVRCARQTAADGF